MRRRILLLVAATTSAIVLAFVIPLCLLVRNMAADRLLADADQEARNVAVLVSSLHGTPGLEDAVTSADAHSVAATTVYFADGSRLGTQPEGGEGQDDGGLSEAELRRARAGSAFTVTEETGTHIVVPVVTADGTDVVATWVPIEEMRRGVGQAWGLIASLGLLLTLVALIIADQLGRRVSTPVIRVARVADRLREGDLAARATAEGPPETQALAIALNRLAERIEELLLLERTAVADLSHRLRTPVTALRIDVEGVEDPGLAERLRRHVGNLQRSVNAIIKDARRPILHGMDVSCDALAVVRGAVDFWLPLAEDERRRLTVDLPSAPIRVDMDAVDLRDVVDILIDNVFAHTPEATPFSVSLRPAGPRPGRAVLEVRDRPAKGAGSRQPAESNDESGSGHGLSIARRAVVSRGGELDVHVSSDGTVATALLPLASGR